MADLNAQQIRDYCRSVLDVESDEVTDDMLNIWMQEGYNEIVAIADNSPTWLHVDYTLTTVGGTQAYDLDAEASLILPAPLQLIEDVRGPTWSLTPKSHEAMRAFYLQTATPSGKPQQFTIWARNLYLWPIPNAAEDYSITGTRQPTDWVTLNTSPDCPADFCHMVAEYTLARAYAQQDDPESAQLILNGWEATVRKLHVRYEDTNIAQPFQVNAGNRDIARTRTGSPADHVFIFPSS